MPRHHCWLCQCDSNTERFPLLLISSPPLSSPLPSPSSSFTRGAAPCAVVKHVEEEEAAPDQKLTAFHGSAVAILATHILRLYGDVREFFMLHSISVRRGCEENGSSSGRGRKRRRRREVEKEEEERESISGGFSPYSPHCWKSVNSSSCAQVDASVLAISGNLRDGGDGGRRGGGRPLSKYLFFSLSPSTHPPKK